MNWMLRIEILLHLSNAVWGLEGLEESIPSGWTLGPGDLVPSRDYMDWRTVGLCYLERPDGLSHHLFRLYQGFPDNLPNFSPSQVPSYVHNVEEMGGVSLLQVASG